MHFGAERRGQGEVKGTSRRHRLNHVRLLSYVNNKGSNHLVQDTLREQGSRV